MRMWPPFRTQGGGGSHGDNISTLNKSEIVEPCHTERFLHIKSEMKFTHLYTPIGHLILSMWG